MLVIHVVYESASVVGYSICWVAGEEFVYTVVLKVCVDFDEVVYCVHDTNASTFFRCFDYYGLVIFEIVKCCLFL